MKRIVLAALAAAALALAVPAFAVSPQSSFDKVTTRSSTTIDGTIVSLNGYVLAIETKAGNRMTFRTDSLSDLPKGLTEGVRVRVTYGPDDTGVSHVVKVRTLATRPAA